MPRFPRIRSSSTKSRLKQGPRLNRIIFLERSEIDKKNTENINAEPTLDFKAKLSIAPYCYSQSPL